MGTEMRHAESSEERTSEENFDTLRGVPGQEKRPASAETENGANPNTFREVGLMPTILPVPSDSDVTHEEITRHYLRLTAVQMEQAVRNRALYTKLARAHGLSNQAIGDELGLTEARIRQIVSEATK